MNRFEVALIIGWIVVWTPGVLLMADVWSTVEYASHGFLVPLVALWAATAHRDRMARMEVRPPRGGFAGMGLGVLGYGIAVGVGDPTAIGIMCVATVALVVWALRGTEWVRLLRFPIAYLVFMVPLPPAWVNPLIIQLQLLVSSVAVTILRAVGVPIYREGNVLELPGDASLFVAEACSGITSLVTLIPIAVFIAYFAESRLVRRAGLVAAVLPIAIAANLLRVLFTVEVAMAFDVETATEGPLHDAAGVGIYVIGCLGLLAVAALMRRPGHDAARERSASS